MGTSSSQDAVHTENLHDVHVNMFNDQFKIKVGLDNSKFFYLFIFFFFINDVHGLLIYRFKKE